MLQRFQWSLSPTKKETGHLSSLWVSLFVTLVYAFFCFLISYWNHWAQYSVTGLTDATCKSAINFYLQLTTFFLHLHYSHIIAQKASFSCLQLRILINHIFPVCSLTFSMTACHWSMISSALLQRSKTKFYLQLAQHIFSGNLWILSRGLSVLSPDD